MVREGEVERRHRTGGAVTLEAKVGERERCDVATPGPDFPCTDRPVLVGIQPEDRVEVGQREIPAAFDQPRRRARSG